MYLVLKNSTLLMGKSKRDFLLYFCISIIKNIFLRSLSVSNSILLKSSCRRNWFDLCFFNCFLLCWPRNDVAIV